MVSVYFTFDHLYIQYTCTFYLNIVNIDILTAFARMAALIVAMKNVRKRWCAEMAPRTRKATRSVAKHAPHT